MDQSFVVKLILIDFLWDKVVTSMLPWKKQIVLKCKMINMGTRQFTQKAQNKLKPPSHECSHPWQCLCNPQAK
jgi:hypothetical protein